MATLNQIIAIEKGVKSRSYSDIGELHKKNQKPDLFNGLAKTYQKKDEAGEELPAENKKVQLKVETVLKSLSKLSSELFEVTARKDWTNMTAKATVKIGDKVVLNDVPVTYLLFLEKQLNDLRTIIDLLPTLDEAETWSKDEASGLYKSDPIITHRTKKVQRPVVMYDATKEHPAQTQLITEDILAGHWHQQKQSGAIPVTEKQKLSERVNQLLLATKEAREAANTVEEVASPDVGEAIFGYLFKKEE